MSICILQGQPVDKVDCKSCFFLIAIARRIFPFSAEPKENLYSDKINALFTPLLFYQTLLSFYHYFKIVLLHQNQI